MKMLITMLSITFISSALMAAGQPIRKPNEGGPCSNVAKFGAVKIFKSVNNEVSQPNVSFSGDIQIRAFLTKSEKFDLTYSVSVDEAANEGSDDFTFSGVYIVKVRALDAQAKKCKVISVSEVENP